MTGSDKHAAAESGREGNRRSHARQEGERETSRKSCNDSKCVCIYAMPILSILHTHYCFAAAITDRDEKGKDFTVGQPAGQTIAPSQMSLHQPISVAHTNKHIRAFLGVEIESAISFPREREQE